MSDLDCFAFESEGIRVTFTRTPSLLLPLIPARIIFEKTRFERFSVTSDQVNNLTRTLTGSADESGLRFQARWGLDPAGWIRFSLQLEGTPDPAWGAFQKLVLLDQEMPAADFQVDLGWRELGNTSREALMDRPMEEGGGLQPPFGYPIYGPDFFVGAEHPMACIEADGNRVSVFHHPLWTEDGLQSVSLIIGVCRPQESPTDVFARYFSTIRRPQPDRAIVEINTFWTDLFDPQTGYSTDLASYHTMAKCWSEKVLAGEKGLVSHFLLDAGWQDTASLYRPQASNGGPDDQALAELGKSIEGEGFAFGLWFSLNGPIGVSPVWAQSEGYRTHDQGTGAGYSANNGKIRYICLTDTRWEEDLSRRFEELINNVPVAFFKGDWDNDAIEDPARYPGEIASNVQLREAIANAMIRIYGRMHGVRPDVALRGAWWLSPWWFPHVDNTHLPNSGDHENADIPSLTQRDSGLTCRDAVSYHTMVRCQSPVPWDVICPHEFASSRRNPVQDTEDSWMNNLAMWVSRGSQYLQMYLAPYGLEGWKSWSIREILRWFRSDEELHWKSGTTMLGADPMRGGVYAYYHQAGDRVVLTIRNPLAHPQALPALPDWGLPEGGWEQAYPYCQRFHAVGYEMSSHEVLVLIRGQSAVGDDVFVNTPQGWKSPWRSKHPLPKLHDLGAPQARLEMISPEKLVVHATLPYGLASAEVVLSIRSSSTRHWQAGLGRYPEDVASFGVPITHVRSHWQSGYAQRRLKASPYDPDRSVLRFPIGSGGEAHAFLCGEERLPEILGAWIEVRESLLPVETPLAMIRPPAASQPLRHLLTIPLE